MIVMGVAALIFVAAVYFVPTLMAYVRGHPRLGAIFLVNLLLGWTVFGWVAAMVWSLADPRVYP